MCRNGPHLIGVLGAQVQTTPSVLSTVANLAQHHQFYKDIVQTQSNLSLVLEDDATFVPCFKSQLEQTLAGVP